MELPAGKHAPSLTGLMHKVRYDSISLVLALEAHRRIPETKRMP